MTERSCWACLTTSKPATVARPASGCSSVARIRTVVVLPAPFGPEQAEDRALFDGRGRAVERADLALARPVDLDQAFGRDGIRAAGCCSGAVGLGGPSIAAPARLRADDPVLAPRLADASDPAWLDRWGDVPPLLLAEFIVWLGFGALLPVLPLYFTEQGVDLARSGSSSPPGRRLGSSASRSSAGSPTGPRGSR